MRQTLRCLLLAVSAAVLLSATAPQPQPFDVLIQNGRVMDGSGNPWVRADVAILSGRIVAVGHLRDAPAARRIDARDRLVTPGFIDVHSHAAEGDIRHIMTRPY